MKDGFHSINPKIYNEIFVRPIDGDTQHNEKPTQTYSIIMMMIKMIRIKTNKKFAKKNNQFTFSFDCIVIVVLLSKRNKNRKKLN